MSNPQFTNIHTHNDTIFDKLEDVFITLGKERSVSSVNNTRSEWIDYIFSKNSNTFLCYIFLTSYDVVECKNTILSLSNSNILTDAYDNDEALREVMKNTHFKLWLPTHSISYISGQLTLVSYTITGANGTVYVKNTQNQE
jgi:hypothetical protein